MLVLRIEHPLVNQHLQNGRSGALRKLECSEVLEFSEV